MVGPNSASTNQPQMTHLLLPYVPYLHPNKSGPRKPGEVVVSDLAPHSSIGWTRSVCEGWKWLLRG